MGDRFAQEAEAQLRACLMAAEQGANVIPVWNKSNREHTIIGSEPPSVRVAAEAAIKKLGWQPKTKFEDLTKLMVDSDVELLRKHRQGEIKVVG